MRLPAPTDGLERLERLARVRLVAIDVDGTLLDRPSDAVAEVIADLSRSLGHYRRGVTLTLATGRTFNGARKVIELLTLPRSTPVILYNGAVICHADGSAVTQLYSFNTTDLDRIIGAAHAAGLSSLVYEVDDMAPVLTGESPGTAASLIEKVTGWADQQGPSVEFNDLAVTWRTPGEPVPGSASAVLIGTPEGVPPSLSARLGELNGVTVTRSSSAFLELRPRGANKGSALAIVAAGRSLTAAEVLAIGDSDNDVEMLAWAGCSVVVANSTQAALAASDFVTREASGAGVVETLRLVFDARRHRLRT